MLNLTVQLGLKDIALHLGFKFIGEDKFLAKVTTDTRKIIADEAANYMFVALKGPNYDGHNFVQAAYDKGIRTFLLQEDFTHNILNAADLTILKVSDTLKALGAISSFVYSRFNLPVIGVTGSIGKTTVKEMVASVLNINHRVLYSAGNYNNEIGLPLTLLRLLEMQYDYIVLEMGATKPGDIRYLASLLPVQVGVITAVAPAHLETMGSLDGIACAKGELYESLATNAVAVIDINSPYCNYWVGLLRRQKIVYFGDHINSQVKAEKLNLDIDLHASFDLCIHNGIEYLTKKVELQVPGLHMVHNALAAAAVLHALGIDIDIIAKGLSLYQGYKRRFERKTLWSNINLIDDTYNSNPVTMKSALELLSEYNGRKVVVMGDMAELGSIEQEAHCEIGKLAKSLHIDEFFALGQLAYHAADAFGTNARWFEDPILLVEELKQTLLPHDVVLIKGSRRMRMENIVDAIINSDKSKEQCC